MDLETLLYMEQTAKAQGAVWAKDLPDQDFVTVVPLIFHAALYVNPNMDGSYDDRYCFASVQLAILATEEFLKTGEWKYWQKHWNENISIKDNYAYRTGEPQEPENALYEVPWDADKLRAEYPYEMGSPLDQWMRQQNEHAATA